MEDVKRFLSTDVGVFTEKLLQNKVKKSIKIVEFILFKNQSKNLIINSNENFKSHTKLRKKNQIGCIKFVCKTIPLVDIHLLSTLF